MNDNMMETEVVQDHDIGEDITPLWKGVFGEYCIKRMPKHYTDILDELESLGWTFEISEEGTDKILIATKGKVSHYCKKMFWSHCIGFVYNLIKYQ